MKCDSPFHVIPKGRLQAVPVPCGRCPPCKLRRVNSWVFRLQQEQKICTSSFFVTLTYDTHHVPISENGFMTLRKTDLQKYFKRLRKLCPGANIRYYAVGEYGTNNKRPHYHGIFFNVPDPNCFELAWRLDGVSIGQIHVGTVSSNSIAYTMKYIDKSDFNRLHMRDDREKEFPLMSKKLGENYLTPEMIKYHKADISRLYVTREGGYRSALPRYYRQKIYSDAEQKVQVDLIQEAVDKENWAQLLEFERLGYPVEYTFEKYQSDKRYYRYKQFYSRLKSRDV